MPYLILKDGRELEVDRKTFNYLVLCVFTGKHPDKTSKIERFKSRKSGYEKYQQAKLELRQRQDRAA